MFRRPLTLLAAVCLCHVLLISSQVQSKSGIPVLQSVAFGSLARVQAAIAGVADAVRSIWSQYFALRGAERENAQLRQRVIELEGQLQAERARTSTARALEQALALQQEVTVKTLAARVIAGDPVPGMLNVTIDRGTDDGIAPDMAVITEGGVVGRVIRVSGHAARVQLLIGRDAGAGAVLDKTGQAGFLAGGFGDGLCRLELLSPLTKVEAGEKVITSGQDGFYPRGYTLGTVERVDGEGKTRVILVRPGVDFTHIEIVLVVLGLPPNPDAPARPANPGKGKGA